MRNCSEFFIGSPALSETGLAQILTLVRLWGIRLRAIAIDYRRCRRVGSASTTTDIGRTTSSLCASRGVSVLCLETNISGQFVACIADHQRSRAILNENVQRLAGCQRAV